MLPYLREQFGNSGEQHAQLWPRRDRP